MTISCRMWELAGWTRAGFLRRVVDQRPHLVGQGSSLAHVMVCLA